MAAPKSRESGAVFAGSTARANGTEDSNCSRSRGSPAVFIERSTTACLASSSTTDGCAPAVMDTTCFTSRPQGTSTSVPLTRPSTSASDRLASMPSGRWTASMPQRPSSQFASKVSTSGAGRLCLPAQRTTTNRSAQDASAPPQASGAAATAKPDSVSADHKASGHSPPSQERSNCGVTVSASSRSMVDSKISLMASAQSEAAGNDAAQDFTRAAAQGEGWSELHQVGENLRVVGAASDAGRRLQQQLRHLGELLFERGAQVLHAGCGPCRVGSGGEFGGH